MVKLLTDSELLRETQEYLGTGGASQDNSQFGFIPAFMDRDSGEVFLSCYTDGRIAKFHLLDGLPEYLIVARDAMGRVISVKETVVSGFILNDCFYNRDEAAALVATKPSKVG